MHPDINVVEITTKNRNGKKALFGLFKCMDSPFFKPALDWTFGRQKME